MFNNALFNYRIKFEKLIGEGSFGSVYLAKNSANQNDIAVKQLPLMRFGDLQVELQEKCISALEQEVNFLKTF